MKVKIGVVSLGCDKNRVDTEVMLATLVRGGYEITHSPDDADVIIINTCAFLESARKESIETALEMANYKQRGKCKKIILTGCLGQKFGDELFDELTEVDAVVGTNDYENICNIVAATLNDERKLYNTCQDVITFGERILTSLPHVAYLKIADGCNNFCTYCLIPYIRGRYRSVEMETIVEHAKQLASQGVKELILVAQDTTNYGKDIYGEPKLVELLGKLSLIDGIVWIRLLYCYPELMSDELIAEISSNPKIVNYVDIPLQHVNDMILSKMNRRTDSKSINVLFDKLKNNNIETRSTFICGFPGETNETIGEMQSFLKKYRIRNVGFFAYSREQGTKAAQMDKQVLKRVKDRYVKRMYKTQFEICKELNTDDIGKTFRCVADEYRDGEYIFRTYFMTPEIDGVVYVPAVDGVEIGNFYDVRITGVRDYDLEGEIV